MWLYQTSFGLITYDLTTYAQHFRHLVIWLEELPHVQLLLFFFFLSFFYLLYTLNKKSLDVEVKMTQTN